MATERTYARITGSDHKFAYPCRFDLWDEIGYEPEYRDTCTYKYKNKGEQEEHTSDSPWCPQQSPHDKTPWIRCNCEFYKLFQLTDTTSLYSPLPKILIFSMISDYTWRYRVSQNFLGFNEKRYEYGHLP